MQAVYLGSQDIGMKNVTERDEVFDCRHKPILLYLLFHTAIFILSLIIQLFPDLLFSFVCELGMCFQKTKTKSPCTTSGAVLCCCLIKGSSPAPAFTHIYCICQV